MKRDPFRVLERNEEERARAWKVVIERIESYRARVSAGAVVKKHSRDAVAAYLDGKPLGPAHDVSEIIHFVADGMEEFNLHTAHPRYFGVFNPHPSFLGILGDTLASAYNPQLASAASARLPIEVEARLIRWLGDQMFSRGCEGHFTNGGTESNLTALTVCLHDRFPSFAEKGIFGLTGRPVIYVSQEAHHSFYRAAQVCGLGRESVREVKADSQLRMDVVRLREAVQRDRSLGHLPLMAVGTLGTTSAGAVDPLEEIWGLCRSENMWFHVDAAWGGAAALLPEFASRIEGLKRADSLTLDLHKWFSLPFSAGAFLCQKAGASARAFELPRSPYMTKQADKTGPEPFESSMQWSRRFLGLKFYLTLLGTGVEGYQEVIRHQMHMGQVLRKALLNFGWRLCNQTDLPVVCFTHSKLEKDPATLGRLLSEVQDSGRYWITSTQLAGHGMQVLRAGIPSFSTTEPDVLAMVDYLNHLVAGTSKKG